MAHQSEKHLVQSLTHTHTHWAAIAQCTNACTHVFSTDCYCLSLANESRVLTMLLLCGTTSINSLGEAAAGEPSPALFYFFQGIKPDGVFYMHHQKHAGNTLD